MVPSRECALCLRRTPRCPSPAPRPDWQAKLKADVALHARKAHEFDDKELEQLFDAV